MRLLFYCMWLWSCMLSPPRGLKLKYHFEFCYVDQKKRPKKKGMPVLKNMRAVF